MADVSISAAVNTSTARGTRSVVFATGAVVSGDSQTVGTSSSNSLQGATGGSQAQGQSFTATASYQCSKVILSLAKTGTPVDNLVLEILTGSMTGTVIGTSNAVSGSGLTSAAVDYSFTFSTAVSIASGTKYYLRLTRDGARDTVNYFRWYHDAGVNSLANGGTITNNSGVWGSESATTDYHFQMFNDAAATNGYFFYMSSTGTFVYSKTTDSGATWGAAVTINATATIIAYDVWFDKWTPGDTGTLIHTWYFDSTNDIVRWRTLNTNGDTLGTERAVFTAASAVAGRGAFVSGTKTRSGYLYCAYDIDAGAERGFHQSTDSGTTWSASLSATFVEATLDTCKLYPATGTGDNNDCWAIYYDASATALTLKLWDNSAVTATESATIQTHTDGATDLTGQFGFDASVRHSDGHLIMAALSQRDVAASAHQVYDITNTSTITTKTAIQASTDDHYYPQVFIDQNTDAIYVAYNGKRDGSEVMDTTTKVYYTKSTDGGTSWSSGDTAYMEGSAGVVLQVWSPLSGPRFYVGWRVAGTLLGNAVNSVDVSVTPSVSMRRMFISTW